MYFTWKCFSDAEYGFGVSIPGETGLGKSTLINSLFLTDLYKDRKITNMEGLYIFNFKITVFS